MPKIFDPKRCAEIVSWPSVQCQRDAKYQHHGKGYCKQHHPETVQAKAEAQRAAYTARHEISQRRFAAEKRRRDVVEAAKRWHGAPDDTVRQAAAVLLYDAVEDLLAAEFAVVAAQ